MVDFDKAKLSADLLESFFRAFDYPSSPEVLIESKSDFPDLLSAQLEYTRLFIGSLKMLAPPYASYYLEPGHLLNGKTASEVESIYNEFGLSVDDDIALPEDHLRYLLAFCALLLKLYEATQDQVLREVYNQFKEEFILSWIDECLALVDEHKQYNYYFDLLNIISNYLKMSV